MRVFACIYSWDRLDKYLAGWVLCIQVFCEFDALVIVSSSPWPGSLYLEFVRIQ